MGLRGFQERFRGHQRVVGVFQGITGVFRGIPGSFKGFHGIPKGSWAFLVVFQRMRGVLWSSGASQGVSRNPKAFFFQRVERFRDVPGIPGRSRGIPGSLREFQECLRIYPFGVGLFHRSCCNLAALEHIFFMINFIVGVISREIREKVVTDKMYTI